MAALKSRRWHWGGGISIVDQFPAQSEFRARIDQSTVILPDAVTQVDITALPTVLVRGTVTCPDPNETLGRLSIGIQHAGRQAGTSRRLTVYSVTDDEGRFEARVIPGKIGISVNTVREGYVQAYHFEQKWSANFPNGQQATVPSGLAEFEIPPVRLLPTAPISGLVVDSTDKPLPNTRVNARHATSYGNDIATTDAAGRFTLKRTPIQYPPRLFNVWQQDKKIKAKVVSLTPLKIQVEGPPAQQ